LKLTAGIRPGGALFRKFHAAQQVLEAGAFKYETFYWRLLFVSGNEIVHL